MSYVMVWVVSLFVFIATSFGLALAYGRLMDNPTPRQFGTTLLGEIVAIGLASIVLFYTIGGGFGPGILLILFMVLVTAVCLWMASIKLVKTLAGFVAKRQVGIHDVTILIVFGILIPAFLLIPIWGGFYISRACDAIDRQGGERIATGLKAYKQSLGTYPNQISSLMPNYLESLPFNVCYLPYAIMESNYSRYQIKSCPGGGAALAIWTVGGGFGQTLDLTTSTWRHYDFSESECNPPTLPVNGERK